MALTPFQMRDILTNGGIGPSIGGMSGNPFGFTGAYGGSPVPQQPAFTPISQALQGQQPPQMQMPGPPQGWPTQPRPMPPMAQGQMPNLATMLAQLGGKFPLMDPNMFMRNASQTPVRQPSERVAPAPVAQTMPVPGTDPTQDPNWAEDTNSGANPGAYRGTVAPVTPTTTPAAPTAPATNRGYYPGEMTPADQWWNPGY